MRARLILTQLCLVLLAGCGTAFLGSPNVRVDATRYLPAFDAKPLAKYNGQALVLRGFENADQNTTIFVYPKSGPHRYGGPVLTSYFWQCFRTSFERIGVRVFEEGQTPYLLPVMELALVHLGDDGFVADVRVDGAGTTLGLRKRYAINGPPLASNEIAYLERRAYYMLSQLFWAIMADPQVMAILAP